MITSGIIRKIDDLGRIVLPKELRKYLNINTGDDFQITVNNNKIILEKYSRLISFEEEIKRIINCFLFVNNYKIYACIDNKIVNEKNVEISEKISKIILDRKIYINNDIDDNHLSNNLKAIGKLIIYPIVLNSDLLGAIIIVGNDNIDNMINTCKIIINLITSKLV